jgi:hypothetical protein
MMITDPPRRPVLNIRIAKEENKLGKTLAHLRPPRPERAFESSRVRLVFMHRLVAVIAFALSLPFGTVAAQATITGRITNDSSKAPLAGVDVVFEASGKRATSDSAGKFVVTGVPAGVGFATIRKIGFRPVRLRAIIFGSDSIDVAIALSPAAVELAPIEVTAAAVPSGMERFAERRAAGFGSFIDSKTLRGAENRRLADLLRGARGVRIQPIGGSKEIATSMRTGRPCPMAIWVDGLKIYAPGERRGPIPDLNDYPIAQLEGVEIYGGEAETPAELGGRGAGCGTIVLWTRRS